MILGYARVSTRHQEIDRQRDALTEYGTDKIYCDIITGREVGKNLAIMLDHLRAGDQVVVTELSRFGRNTGNVCTNLNQVLEAGVSFVSLKDGAYDPSQPTTKALMHEL